MGFEIEIELLIRALYRGYRIGEFSSHERERAGGRMKSSAIRHGLRFFWSILKWGIPWRLRLLRRQMRIGRRGT